MLSDNRRRGPRFKLESWTVEPFDHEFELWAVAHEHSNVGSPDGFYWLLVIADPSLPRVRSIPRAQGVAEIRERLDDGRDEEVVLGGAVNGDEIEIHLMNLNVSLTGAGCPVGLSPITELLSRVSERLRDLYFDDFGNCESFEEARSSGLRGGGKLRAFLEGRMT